MLLTPNSPNSDTFGWWLTQSAIHNQPLTNRSFQMVFCKQLVNIPVALCQTKHLDWLYQVMLQAKIVNTAWII